MSTASASASITVAPSSAARLVWEYDSQWILLGIRLRLYQSGGGSSAVGAVGTFQALTTAISRGTLSRQAGRRLTGTVYECLTFSGGNTADLKYPDVQGVVFAEMAELAFDKDGNTVTPGFSVDNALGRVTASEPFYGFVRVEYKAGYTVYEARPDDELKYGTAYAFKGDAVATLEIVPPSTGDPDKYEVYRVTSEYLVDDVQAWEKPVNWPTRRSYSTGDTAPAEGECQVLQRTHECGYLPVGNTNFNYDAQYLPPFFPFSRASGWIPQYTFQQAAPPASETDLEAYNRLDWDGIKQRLRDKYPGITGL